MASGPAAARADCYRPGSGGRFTTRIGFSLVFPVFLPEGTLLDLGFGPRKSQPP